MKRPVSLGEIISFGIVVLGAVLSFWINTNVRLSALELRQNSQDKANEETKSTLQKINDKLDKLNDGQNDIKITLQNKQDRK